MELFIIRHGESWGNLVTQDMPDAELTELGRQQGVRVGECLKDAGITDIIVSPLVRALDTARPLARALRLPMRVWKNTCEIRSRGPYTGPSVQRLSELYPEAVFPADLEPDGWRYAGDETAETGHLRAGRVFDDLCAHYADKRVALFAHGGFNRQLLLAALGLGYDSRVYFQQNNGCIYWLTVTPERTRLNYMGDTRPITQEGVRIE